jgi:RNA polymerase sigma-70 factor (ECF subfamily)
LWLWLARQGSRAALGRAFVAERPRLVRAARRSLDARLKAKLSAEDLVQDTFVDAQRNFDQFRGRGEREFCAWLLGILRHRLANNVRHFRLTQQRTVDRELPPQVVEPTLSALHDAADGPDAALLAREEQRLVRAGLARMREPLRSVLIERACQGATFAQIAALHGWTPKMARTKWGRAARQLRRLLTEVA